MRYYEDFAEGQVYELGEAKVSEAEILEFARKFDPQPFHIDPEAARRSMYGGLIASGWHTASLYMGLMVRNLLQDASSLGSAGIDELRWLKPVRPGDTLHAVGEVLEKKPSKSQPDRGIIKLRYACVNHRGEEVLTVIGIQIVRRKHP